MYRKELLRVYELRDIAQTPPSSDACFLNFEESLSESPTKYKHFRDIELELQNLDSTSWEHLKAEVAPLLKKRHPTRGWQALFDKLNEAKGYGHLRRLGCTNIGFIPRSAVGGQQTPDLQAVLGPINVLCEVKTINISECEVNHRISGSSRSILLQLPIGIFKKLKSDLEAAREQLAAVFTNAPVRNIIYLIINFDDSLHEYADDYAGQISTFLATIAMPDVEIEFHAKPPFYSATT